MFPTTLKLKYIILIIVPVLLYGLDCVNWTTSLLNKIETFQNHIMRFMTKKCLSDHIRIQTLLRNTGLIPIVPIIKSKPLNSTVTSNAVRKDMSKICLEGMITGTKSRGYQHKR